MTNITLAKFRSNDADIVIISSYTDPNKRQCFASSGGFYLTYRPQSSRSKSDDLSVSGATRPYFLPHVQVSTMLCVCCVCVCGLNRRQKASHAVSHKGLHDNHRPPSTPPSIINKAATPPTHGPCPLTYLQRSHRGVWVVIQPERSEAQTGCGVYCLCSAPH